MKIKTYLSVFFMLALGAIIIVSCDNENYIPKPRGYFRISFPEKKYRLFDSLSPYVFEYPVYSYVHPNIRDHAEPFWYNLEFPRYKGTLYLSYKKITNDSLLYQYFEDSYVFVSKHIAKADDIETVTISNDTNRVYGVIYNISGNNVASTYQFCVTDSTEHFLRGALYFYVVPNNDSLSPVINFIKQDVDHLLKTLKWKKPDYSKR